MAAIETPCIKVCIVDPGFGRCLGCARSLDEIAGWAAYTAEERSRVIAELPQRMEIMRRRPAAAAAS
jgi:predicted Fe-S protein YdhL (DUF1289 family)